MEALIVIAVIAVVLLLVFAVVSFASKPAENENHWEGADSAESFRDLVGSGRGSRR